jgi:hypothetical protein
MPLRPANMGIDPDVPFSGTVQMALSAPSRLSDIRALLDSYGIELVKDGRVLLCAPLHWCAYEPDEEHDAWNSPFPPVIDKTIEIRLIRYEPPVDDFLRGIRERTVRWPFFVEWPLEICLAFRDQWWLYKFSPGKFYEERQMDYGTANDRPGAEPDTRDAK